MNISTIRGKQFSVLTFSNLSILILGFLISFFFLPQALFAGEVSRSSVPPRTSGAGITDITDDIYCKGLDHFDLPDPSHQCPRDDDGNGEPDPEPDPENAAPTVTLLGDSEMNLTVGDTYDDPGATADDPEDGDLTPDIVVGGDIVDTGTPGTYIVTYSVTDSDGATHKASRTVIVEEVQGDGGGDDGDDGDGDDGNGEPVDNGGGGGGGHTSNAPTGSGGRVAGAVPTLFETPTSCFPYILEYIRLGASNNPVEVLKLQQFLRDEEGFSGVPLSGVYGQTTFNAVHAFQQRYASDVLSPWGASVSTGFVYYTTQKKINEIHCNNQQQFAFTEGQLAEIENYKARVGTAISEGLPLPDTSTVGSIEAPALAEGEEVPEEGEGNGTQLAGAGSAGAVAESSLGRFFRGIGGFFGRAFGR